MLGQEHNKLNKSRVEERIKTKCTIGTEAIIIDETRQN